MANTVNISQAEQAVINMERSTIQKLKVAVDTFNSQIESIDADNLLTTAYPSIGRRLTYAVRGLANLHTNEINNELVKFESLPGSNTTPTAE